MARPLVLSALLAIAVASSFGCDAPTDQTCGSGTRLEGNACVLAIRARGGAGGASMGGSGGKAIGGGIAVAGSGGQSAIAGSSGANAIAGGGGQSATGGGGGANAIAGSGGANAIAGSGGANAIAGGGGANAIAGSAGQNAVGGSGGQNAIAGSAGQNAVGGSGGAASAGCALACASGEICDAGTCRSWCGVASPTGSEDFVLSATQWRLATFLYLRHFGQDNTAEVKASMSWAKEHGFNAVTLPASWDELEVSPADVTSGAQLALLGEVLDHAKAIGLKVRVDIWLNRFFKAANDQDPNTPFYGPDDLARSPDGSSEGDLSFHAPRLGNAFAFVKRVLAYVKPWHEAGTIGWYSVVHNTTAELGYAHTAQTADFGPAAKGAFRSWLLAANANPRAYDSLAALNAAWGKSYGSLEEVEPPSLAGYDTQDVFAGRRGEDFWRFREFGLRNFLARLRATLDETVANGWTRPVRVINDYGSVYDRLGPARQSHDFPGHLGLLGPYGYGVKQNADNAKPIDEQRFAMDLLTSQTRDLHAASFNEAFLQGLPTNQWADVVQAWLDSGANGFSVYTNFASPTVRTEIAALADALGQRGYWGGPVRCPQYQGAVATTASGLVHHFWDGPQPGGDTYFDRYKAASKGKNAQFSFKNDLWP